MRALILVVGLCALPIAAQAFDPADPKYFCEAHDVTLEGNLLFNWPRTGAGKHEATLVMVCGMKSPASYLSLRKGPDSGTTELMRLPPFATLALDGTATADTAWAKVESYAIKADATGRTIPDGPLENTPVQGWVSTRYLCHFTH